MSEKYKNYSEAMSEILKKRTQKKKLQHCLSIRKI